MNKLVNLYLNLKGGVFMKKFLSMTLALIMTMALAIPAFATETVSPVEPDPTEGRWIMPLDLFIDSGEINNKTGLEVSKKLNKDNGKYVNLYVENKGSGPVVATINGKSERTFKKGESGHIYVEVTQGWFGADKEYEFKVVPGTNGGTVNIHYEIAQRDTE